MYIAALSPATFCRATTTLHVLTRFQKPTQYYSNLCYNHYNYENEFELSSHVSIITLCPCCQLSLYPAI